jgi:hypothetical protein
VGVKDECIYDFGGKVRGERPIGRTRRRAKDNIKIGWGVMD